MNIVDSIIAGVALISVLIVVVIITRSLKSVDKEILRDIQSGDLDKKKKFITRLKQTAMFFLERSIGKLKRGMQRVHFWAIKERRKSKSDAIKAKDELTIKEDDQPRSKELGVKKSSKEDKQVNKISSKGSILEEMSLQDDEVIMDSVIKSGGDNKDMSKSSFIKGLFKSKSGKRRDVDIKKIEDNFSEEWSLGGSANIKSEKVVFREPKEKFQDVDSTEDAVLGVDRKILEKKILQKIDKEPTSVSNYHELGELYIKMKKYDDAMEVFGYILDVSPNDLEAKRRQDKIKLLSQPKVVQSRRPGRR